MKKKKKMQNFPPMIIITLILCLAGVTLSTHTRDEQSVEEKLNRHLENLEVNQIMECDSAKYKIELELRNHQALYDTCLVARGKLIQETAAMSRTKAQLMGLKLKRDIVDYAHRNNITNVIVSPQDRLLNCLEVNAENYETSMLRNLQAIGCEWISENLRIRKNHTQRRINTAAQEYWQRYEG